MVWDVILQTAAEMIVGAAVGAAVGYGVAAIIEALSVAFERLWKNFVATSKQIWGYVTEATEHYLALVAQFLDNNWPEIESYLRQEFGYRNEWLLATFKHGLDTVVAFVDPKQTYREPFLISVRPLDNKYDGIQLPSVQNPMVTKLSLS